MSLISERVKRLRDRARILQETKGTEDIVKDFNETAALIEEISAKLALVNLEASEKHYDCNKCRNVSRRRICKVCNDGDCFEKTNTTNADRIRQMSDKELAEFISVIKQNEYDYSECPGTNGNYCAEARCNTNSDILAWLKS